MIAFVNLSLLVVVLVATHYTLFWVGNFYSLSADNWAWLMGYAVANHAPPNWFLWTVCGAFASWLTLVFSVQVIASRVGGTTKQGKHGSETLRGSAHWATRKEIKDTGLLRSDGVAVGGLPTFTGKTELLYDSGPEHVLFEAPTRGGKGISLILWNLLTWMYSVIVLDLKDENCNKSGGWRAAMGQLVLRFAPADEHGSVRFNPLAEVRLGTDHEIADVQNITIMVVDPNGKGLKDFWMKSSFSWIAACMLHVLYRKQSAGEKTASLPDVYRFMSGDELGLEQTIKSMAEFDHGRPDVDRFVHSQAHQMLTRLDKAPQEFSGIHSSALAELNLYNDPIIAKNISESDFRISDLMNGDKPATLYLVTPPNDIDRLRPLMRLVLNQILNRLMDNGPNGKPSYKHRMLLMLDEFNALHKMEIFETALAYMASYGLKAFIVVQSHLKVIQHYGKENGIMPNCHIHSCLTPSDYETAKLYQNKCGEQTIIRKRRDISKKPLTLIGSSRVHMVEEKRWLLTADEAQRMKKPVYSKKKGEEDRVKKPGDMLVFMNGAAPIYGQMPLYFRDKELEARSKIPFTGSVLPQHSSGAVGPAALPADGIVKDTDNPSQKPSPSEAIRALATKEFTVDLESIDV